MIKLPYRYTVSTAQYVNHSSSDISKHGK